MLLQLDVKKLLNTYFVLVNPMALPKDGGRRLLFCFYSAREHPDNTKMGDGLSLRFFRHFMELRLPVNDAPHSHISCQLKFGSIAEHWQLKREAFRHQ